MGGGHSADSENQYNAGNFDQQDIENFSKDNSASGFDPNRVKQLSNAYVVAQGGYGAGGWFNGAKDDSNQNISDVVAAFNTWKQQQTTQAQNYSAYTDLVAQQPGRDQTIIGPQATPGTVIGGR